MRNVKHEKRICPNDSFTIACGLSWHNCSGTRHGNIRKSARFLSLPNKRSLFTGLSRTNYPLDSVLSTHLHSAHISILSKIANWLKDKLETHDENGAPHHPLIVLDLDIDETRILERHSCSNKSHYFGLIDNNIDELATSTQCHLMTTLTEKNQ